MTKKRTHLTSLFISGGNKLDSFLFLSDIPKWYSNSISLRLIYKCQRRSSSVIRALASHTKGPGFDPQQVQTVWICVLLIRVVPRLLQGTLNSQGCSLCTHAFKIMHRLKRYWCLLRKRICELPATYRYPACDKTNKVGVKLSGSVSSFPNKWGVGKLKRLTRNLKTGDTEE